MQGNHRFQEQLAVAPVEKTTGFLQELHSRIGLGRIEVGVQVPQNIADSLVETIKGVVGRGTRTGQDRTPEPFPSGIHGLPVARLGGDGGQLSHIPDAAESIVVNLPGSQVLNQNLGQGLDDDDGHSCIPRFLAHSFESGVEKRLPMLRRKVGSRPDAAFQDLDNITVLMPDWSLAC